MTNTDSMIQAFTGSQIVIHVIDRPFKQLKTVKASCPADIKLKLIDKANKFKERLDRLGTHVEIKRVLNACVEAKV